MWSAVEPSLLQRCVTCLALGLALVACPAAEGAAPPGYDVVNTVHSGQALSRRMPGVKSVTAALRATAADLERHFGSKPLVRGAYEDTRDHLSGGAGFNATVKGRPVQGIISCRIGPEDAYVVVVYADTDAPAGDWTALMAPPTGGGVEAVSPKRAEPRAAAARVALRPFTFPDGTCVMGLAPGWRTNAQSCAGAAVIKGPADQTVSMGLSWTVNTPDSMAVQMHRQIVASALQLGGRAPPFEGLVAPFTGPLGALKNLAPQLSQQAGQREGKPFVLDNLVQRQDARANLQGGRAALLSWGITQKDAEGRSRHYRAQASLETAPVGQGAWMMVGVIAQAPDATFERDLPVMVAMLQSVKENAQAINQKGQQAMAARRQSFEQQQREHREVTKAYDQQNRDWNERQVDTARRSDDFSELMRGYRTVEDTTTGERGSVNLGNATLIVDKLNEGDPGRYKQIPLRDELNPKK